jgi:hypothetical protein
LLPRSPNPAPDSLNDNVPLKFGNRGHNRKHSLPKRGAGVDILLVGNELDSEVPEFIKCGNQMLGRTGKPVKPPTQYTIEKSFTRIFHQSI